MEASVRELAFAPPSEERVRERTWALAALVCRAFVETFEDQGQARALHAQVLEWIETVGIGPELEPGEVRVLETETGSLDRRALIDGTWRSEGLGVFAWALGARELPPHDQIVDPYEVANSVLFLAEDSLERAAELRLRPRAELDRMSRVLQALDWRLQEYSLHPHAIDFGEFARSGALGPLELDGVPLVGGDLAIKGVAIVHAPEADVRRCQSIALERHRAIAWLRGAHRLYSQVEVSKEGGA